MRLQYTPNPPTPATEADAAIVSRIAARRAPRPLQPLDLALLHAPAVADGWNAFLGSIRERTSLGARVRELAISRVAVVNGAWYEWGHHAPLAAAAGVSEAGIAIVKREVLVEAGDGQGDGGKARREALEAGLSEGEWAVLLYTDEMTRSVKVKDATFALLKAAFTEREVVEITATVAAYNCVSRFLVALDVGEKNGTGPDDVAEH
ncbi:AhpD-like protein [Rostrohypoxylon terebratum]|nr:AhpD-like protein [Rostrohypoxylon terebratum]